MTPRRRVLLERVGRLRPPEDRGWLVSVGVGLESVCALWSTSEVASFFGAEFRDPEAARPSMENGEVVATTYPVGSTELLTTVALRTMPVDPDLVQPLPGGEVLVVARRCAWRPDGPDLNAAAFDPGGALSRQGCLGDDIIALQVSVQGTVWAAYGDEGVFGNMGWGGTYYHDEDPGTGQVVSRATETPLGAPGLVQWSRDFDKISDCGTIDYWCEALNVGPNEVRAWFDSEPFMMRIRESGEERVTGSVGRSSWGFTAAVCNESAVAVIGGYDKRGSVTAGIVENGVWRPTWRGELRLPDKKRLPARTRIEGRGSRAHVFVDDDWYVYDFADA